MIIGALTLDLAIFGAQSLKDKRRVILSVKQRLQNRFHVSVAEVAHADNPKQCQLGVAMVSQDSRVIHSHFDKIVDFVRGAKGLSVIDYHRELL